MHDKSPMFLKMRGVTSSALQPRRHQIKSESHGWHREATGRPDTAALAGCARSRDEVPVAIPRGS